MRFVIPILALLVVIVLANSLFVVKEGESALVLQFGRIEGAGAVPADSELHPGLHFKFPLIQNVVRFDRRILNLEAPPERYTTSEKKAVNVDFFVKWQIDDSLTYYRRFGADEFQTNANNRISSIVKNALGFEFRTRSLGDLIANSRSDITEHVREQSNKSTESVLGIRIVDVRIKRIEFPDEVVSSVYKDMQAERSRLASEQRSNGKEQAQRIRADADKQALIIKAEAERDAQQLRGEGDAKAAEIYAAAYGKDPEFYAFYRSMQAYRDAFRNGGVLVLDPKSEFLRYFESAKSEGKP